MNFMPRLMDVDSSLIYTFLLSSCMSVDSEEQTNVNRKAVASIRAACVYLPAFWPVPPHLCATEKTNAWRETGRQVSLLNSDEFSCPPRNGRENRSRHLSATHRDEMVSSTVERQLCSLCSIGVKNMWLGNNEEEQISCLLSYLAWWEIDFWWMQMNARRNKYKTMKLH